MRQGAASAGSKPRCGPLPAVSLNHRLATTGDQAGHNDLTYVFEHHGCAILQRQKRAPTSSRSAQRQCSGLGGAIRIGLSVSSTGDGNFLAGCTQLGVELGIRMQLCDNGRGHQAARIYIALQMYAHITRLWPKAQPR